MTLVVETTGVVTRVVRGGVESILGTLIMGVPTKLRSRTVVLY
jgi:hypothetical protein